MSYMMKIFFKLVLTTSESLRNALCPLLTTFRTPSAAAAPALLLLSASQSIKSVAHATKELHFKGFLFYPPTVSG
jgi:hypothetical protein